MRTWIQRLIVVLLLLASAPTAWATISANSPLGENLPDASVLQVEFIASGELHQDSSGSCDWTTAECSVAPSSASSFSQLREASTFLRDEAGIASSAYRRQIIESFGSDLRVGVYEGQAYQYSGGPGVISRYSSTQSRYLSTSILNDPINELALPTKYNAATLLQAYDVAPTRALIGTAAPQNFGVYLPGGAQQIYVPTRSVLTGGNIIPR